MNTPTFVSVDPVAILDEILANYESLSGTTCYPGQPEYLICTSLAYQKALLLNRINETGKALLLDLSSAPVTDYLASLLGVTRLTASKAACTLRFTLVTGHLQVLIPAGTRVASTDGEIVFQTIDDKIVPVGVDVVDIVSECQTAGISGNGYGIGTISVLQDPYAFISSVSNLEITYGGAAEESDAVLKERVKQAPSQFSVAGSRDAYIFWTKSASSAVIDVAVLTYSEDNTIQFGQVDIYPLLSDPSESTAINAIIAEVLSSDKVRPITDTVVVNTPDIIEYSLSIDVIEQKGISNAALTSLIYNAVKSYTDSKSLLLGNDIVASKIEALSMLDGVYDANVTITSTGTITNNNLIVPANKVCKCIDITINISGVNE